MPTSYSFNLEGLDTPAATAAIGGFLGFTLAVGAALAVLMIIAGWKIFEKAGEKGWKILIPIYDGYILFKICGIDKWFWAFLGASIFASILACINPPVAQSISYSGDILTYTDLSATIDWSQHIPYLIGVILTAGIVLAAGITVAVKLAKAFGKGAGFTLGLIFLSGIFYMILGFGKAKYDAKRLDK